jgi:hypothetical protein
VTLPPLLESRGTAARLAITVLAPLVLGTVTGIMLGVSEAAYVALNVVATIGGFLAGLEHLHRRGAMARGLVGGACFGGSILIAHAIAGNDALAKLPEPAAVLLVFTITGGVVLAALGSLLRTRLERGRAAAGAEAQAKPAGGRA